VNLHKSIVNGEIVGQVSVDGKSLEWLGILYGKPPVGELRWRAPQNPDNWSEPLPTTKFQSDSIQVKGNQIFGSENCLYLNVFRPNNLLNALPVLFFIHGGNNQVGSARNFNGNLFSSSTNIIVVTINHRLNAFGYLNINAIKTGDPIGDSGNFALLDIAKSLDWTKENISFFGGDPNNITTRGFSSGGRSSIMMTISPLFKGKFSKIISFCGGMTTFDPKEGAKIATKALSTLVIEDRIVGTEKGVIEWINSAQPKVHEYLMSIKADRIVKLMGNANIRMSVFPHLFTDGFVILKEEFDVIQVENMRKYQCYLQVEQMNLLEKLMMMTI
jgi:para-nitrobenzyl esterase